jgi:hypothetical protein
MAVGTALRTELRRRLGRAPDRHWRAIIPDVAYRIANKAMKPGKRKSDET